LSPIRSERLAVALDEKPTQPAPAAKWPAKQMGKPKLDLDDKEAVRSALDGL